MKGLWTLVTALAVWALVAVMLCACVAIEPPEAPRGGALQRMASAHGDALPPGCSRAAEQKAELTAETAAYADRG